MAEQSVSRATILDGRAVADGLFPRFCALRERLEKHRGNPPGLCVLAFGHHPPSDLYIERKSEMARRLGFLFEAKRFDNAVSLPEALAVIEAVNRDPSIDGVIVQMPVSPSVCAQTLLEAVSPHKDVDGLHALNRGALYAPSSQGFVPCTPWGCVQLLDHYNIPLKGRHVVVVGRSLLVGRPLAAYCLRRDATVTVTHRYTQDLSLLTRQADIVFVAAGAHHLIDASYVHPQSVVVDVGIHRTPDGTITGDVDFASVAPRVKAISPVPGGVGPLTVMGLMHNTLQAAYASCQLPFHV
ncbi:bifunctional 5,10-methylenetetrahydrofolate dehydrogenase/5,10-methenyltetrahydrofolate cyclohydrolase [Candidatus Hepatobacter penaei]|uniref:bifunctional 5,10-methylenetetrahydrofolate dehydrogenase/5,10-methenyltetrahydrofolate cyclohydrolase n=1 Tax=Candidatus Hepatobacter penaei TaxID=1274402 RepID=UPI0004F3862D|nr:bifunctional 5,10-methylenetetrahydrofolate dehydrogenase/5,10-methenyltetrahydrofolate cyclohydrolase [Candidatus Hepatobacter penaei]